MNLAMLVDKQSMGRMNQIFGILSRYGLADWLGAERPDFLSEQLTGENGEDLCNLSTNERIRMAITELGTTYIKFGQLLSTRADIVGPELAAELACLQADTPPDPPEVARMIIQSELNGPIEEIFASFENQPCQSGSIAQVHVAKLLDGTDVVVKVQHLGIRDQVLEDLKFLGILAELAEEHSEKARRFRVRELARLFSQMLVRELDFKIELSNMKTIIENFKGDPCLQVPRPYGPLSTQRVLVMERFEGYSVADKVELERQSVDTRSLAENGARIFLDMIFRDGIYHADPHPGNIYVLKNGRIGLLDFGKVELIDERTQEQFENIAYAFAKGDTLLLNDELLRVCAQPPNLNREAVRTDVNNLIHNALGKSVNQMDMRTMISGCFQIAAIHGLVLPPKLNILFMVLIQLEGTSQSLDTDFELAELLKKYHEENEDKRLSPERVAKRLHRQYLDWQHLVKNLPKNLSDILNRLEQGELNIVMDVRGVDRPVNRLTYGVVIAALIVASALLWSNQVPPIMWGFSVIGVITGVLSFFLGLNLLFRISSSGGLD